MFGLAFEMLRSASCLLDRSGEEQITARTRTFMDSIFFSNGLMATASFAVIVFVEYRSVLAQKKMK